MYELKQLPSKKTIICENFNSQPDDRPIVCGAGVIGFCIYPLVTDP